MPSHLGTASRARPRAATGTRSEAAAGRVHDIVGIAINLCRTLDYLHSMGLVHRDVKPANVFLGGDGRVTLLDFGLVCPARGVQGSCAAADSCVGTMEYAAPEQIRGEPVDARADIYSLGCMLYELVTGRRPIEADRSEQVAERQLAWTPIAPSDLVTGVPPALEHLLQAMLAKRPEDRPSTAHTVAAKLATVGCRETWVSPRA
jgi:serine/threonine protein kinase